jgi:rubrerythrin
MLSKRDYQSYLNQIVELERRMSLVYRDCSGKLRDENIKKLCNGLSLAEEKHAVMVDELVALLNV